MVTTATTVLVRRRSPVWEYGDLTVFERYFTPTNGAYVATTAAKERGATHEAQDWSN